MTTTTPRGRSGHTRLITVAAIAAVVVAGAFAIAANVGILNAGDNSKVGQLSAAGAASTPNPQVVDVYVDSRAATSTAVAVTATTASNPAAVQRFTVDSAGTVAVAANGATLRLDSVEPTDGWSWNLAQSRPDQLSVTLTDGTRTLEFLAVLGSDGTVAANVDETTAASSATTAPPDQGSGHDDHEYEGGGDDD